MPLLRMREEMLQRLHDSGASTEQIAGYIDVWELAESQSNVPYPCPSCYLGEASRFVPLPGTDGTRYVQCIVCCTKFDLDRECPIAVLPPEAPR